MSRLLGGRHWLALRRLNGRWWNLDSCLPAPRLVARCCEDDAASGQEACAAAAAEVDRAASAPSAEAAQVAGSGEPASGGGEEAGGAEAGGAAAAAAAAQEEEADAAAVRRFLADQLQRRDAKVFRVIESSLASHPVVQEQEDSPHAPAANGGT